MNCVVWELNLNEVIKGENLEASSFVGSDRTCVSERPVNVQPGSLGAPHEILPMASDTWPLAWLDLSQ